MVLILRWSLCAGLIWKVCPWGPVYRQMHLYRRFRACLTVHACLTSIMYVYIYPAPPPSQCPLPVSGIQGRSSSPRCWVSYSWLSPASPSFTSPGPCGNDVPGMTCPMAPPTLLPWIQPLSYHSPVGYIGSPTAPCQTARAWSAPYPDVTSSHRMTRCAVSRGIRTPWATGPGHLL